MAKLYIAEFASTILMHGRGGSAAQYPAIARQVVDFSGGMQVSTAFNTNTTMIRVNTDSTCSLVIDTNPTATTSSDRLSANQTEYFGVSPGHKLAVITNT